MEKIKNQEESMDTAFLANEMTLRSYRWSRVNMRKLFQNMSIADYTAIWTLSKHIEEEEHPKIYLKDISEKLKLAMPRVSAMARGLQEKGLVHWKHDGKGEKGTYIQITENGLQQAKEQQERIKEFYQTVIEQFGKERFIRLLQEMGELEEIMSQEMEKRDKK